MFDPEFRVKRKSKMAAHGKTGKNTTQHNTTQHNTTQHNNTTQHTHTHTHTHTTQHTHTHTQHTQIQKPWKMEIYKSNCHCNIKLQAFLHRIRIG